MDCVNDTKQIRATSLNPSWELYATETNPEKGPMPTTTLNAGRSTPETTGTTSTMSPTPSRGIHTGLAAGAIAGIVIGSIVAIVLGIVAIMVVRSKLRRAQVTQNVPATGPQGMSSPEPKEPTPEISPGSIAPRPPVETPPSDGAYPASQRPVEIGS
jgi:hypothetical protein